MMNNFYIAGRSIRDAMMRKLLKLWQPRTFLASRRRESSVAAPSVRYHFRRPIDNAVPCAICVIISVRRHGRSSSFVMCGIFCEVMGRKESHARPCRSNVISYG